MVAFNGHLIFTGGSEARYRYADDPGKAWVLLRGASEWSDRLVGELLAPRMWHACAVVNVHSEVGEEIELQCHSSR